MQYERIYTSILLKIPRPKRSPTSGIQMNIAWLTIQEAFPVQI